MAVAVVRAALVVVPAEPVVAQRLLPLVAETNNSFRLSIHRTVPSDRPFYFIAASSDISLQKEKDGLEPSFPLFRVCEEINDRRLPSSPPLLPTGLTSARRIHKRR